MSRLPKVSTAVRTASARCPASPACPATATATSGPPRDSTAAASASGLRAVTTTRAPRSTRLCAIASPMPRLPPVTSAVRPSIVSTRASYRFCHSVPATVGAGRRHRRTRTTARPRPTTTWAAPDVRYPTGTGTRGASMPARRRTVRAAGLTPAAAPARLRVGIIGAGRVGAVLGAALSAAGHDVVAASGLSAASAERAARLLPGVPLLPADEVVAAADLVVLAVPDDTLPGLVAGLSETGAWRAGQLAFHTSGAHGLAVLAPAERAGVLPLALHPAMTFGGTPEDADRLAGAPFGVTSRPEYRAVAETLVLEMGGEPFFVAEDDRRLYHAALVTGANHLVTLVAEAADLLRTAGVTDAARVLGPLLTAALDNGLRRGDRGLTGPVSRGDVGTVRDHLETLTERAPESVGAYVAMAQRTTERALAAGRLKRHEGAPLLALLDGHVPGSLASERAEG